jgi:hypothetical protein
MKMTSTGLLALATAIASLPMATVPVEANKNLPNSLGPDQWITCAAIIPGSGTPGRHYYAWWNPGWPAGHNSIQSAIDICNQWFGGIGPVVQPIAGTPHNGPHQYVPRITVSATRPVVKKDLQAIGVNDPSPPPPCPTYSGPANQNPC